MAARNFEIIIKLTDNASKGLDDVEKKVRKTGKAAVDSEGAFKKFAKTIAVAGASVALFSRAISKIGSSIEEGADIERLTNQYERVLGPKGKLFQSIDNLTTTAVDKFEVMRKGLELHSLGIIQNSDQLALVAAKATTAAKLVGKDGTEGFGEFVDFMKTMDVSRLTSLGLIAKSNVALQMEMAVLHKVGGAFGGVISNQAKYAIGMRLLDIATAGHLKDEQDLSDILKNQAFTYKYLRSEIGQLLGAALGPLIRTITGFVLNMAQTIEHLRKTDKTFMFMVKTILVTTAAVAGLVSVLLTLKYASAALTAAGIGLPVLLGTLGGLSVLFFGITSKAEKFTDKLKIIGAVVRGVWELITSFDRASGKSKISKSVLDILDKYKLTGFVKTVSQVGIAVKVALEEIYGFVYKWSSKLFNLFKKISGAFTRIFTGDSTSGDEKNKLLPNLDAWAFKAKAVILALGAFLAGSKLFSIFGKGGNLLSNLPIVGRLFGGRAPKGTKSDPIWTKSADNKSVGFLKGTGEFLFAIFRTMGIDKAIIGLFENLVISFEQGGFIQVIKDLGPLFRLLSEQIGVFEGVLGGVEAVLSEFVAPILVFTAAIWGAVEGIADTIEEWEQYFQGIVDLSKAVFDVVSDFVEHNVVLKALKDAIVNTVDAFVETAKFIVKLPFTILQVIAEGFKNILGWMGLGAGKVGEMMTNLAKQISPNSVSSDKKSSTSKKLDMVPEYANTATTAVGQKVSGQKSLTSVPRSEDTTDAIDKAMSEISQIKDKDAQAAAQANVQQFIDAQGQKGLGFTSDDLHEIIKNQTGALVEHLSNIEDILQASKPRTSYTPKR